MGIFNSKHKIIRKIGDGAFSEVYLVKDNNCKLFARKDITIKKKYSYLVYNEISIMRKLDNNNIVRFYDFTPMCKLDINLSTDLDINKYHSIQNINAFKKRKREIDRAKSNLKKTLPERYLIKLLFEYCEGGDLYDYISNILFSSGSINIYQIENSAKIIIKQILQGTAYLHKSGIIHRDLKPENILLKKKEDITHIVISDFGLSTNYNLIHNLFSAKLGTPIYWPPEIYLSNDIALDKEKKYNEKFDVWSIGVILYLLLTDKMPFNELDIKYIDSIKCNDDKQIYVYDKLKLDIETSMLLQGISDNAKSLLVNLLDVNYKTRCSCKTALLSNWFTESTIPKVLYRK